MILWCVAGFSKNGQIKLIIMGLLVALAGCTTLPESADSRTEVRMSAAESARFNESTTLQAGSGAMALLEKADEYTKMRRLDLAITTLERALRMEIRNAWIWNRLAVAHLEARNRQQAVHLATKSNALVGEDHPLREMNNSLIARARK